ncbi:MAG: DUF1700 domain-containing protein [Mobilitalea sp.]
MTKLEFMKELEQLLPDIPSEEREEALRYYNGYFEDAGEEREEDIIKELGSPAKVAAIIKADLSANPDERESRGYYTEKGYQDTIYKEEKYEVVGAATKVHEERKEEQKTHQSYYESKEGSNNRGASSHNTNGSTSNRSVIIIIALLTSPIWFPVFLSILGVVFGLVCAVFGILLGFGVAGIALIVSGIAVFFYGLIQLSVPLIGILFVGISLILFGLGMLLTIFCIFICRTVLPAMFRFFIDLCRLPFKNRGAMA